MVERQSPASPLGSTVRPVSRTARVVPAPITVSVSIRRRVTRSVSRHCGLPCHPSGRSNSGEVVPGRSLPVSVHASPSKSSRSATFQYDGRRVSTRSTSAPSRGQVMSP